MNPQLTYVTAQHHQQDLLRAARRAQRASEVTRPHRLAGISRTILNLKLVRRERKAGRPIALGRA